MPSAENAPSPDGGTAERSAACRESVDQDPALDVAPGVLLTALASLLWLRMP